MKKFLDEILPWIPFVGLFYTLSVKMEQQPWRAPLPEEPWMDSQDRERIAKWGV